MKGSSPDGAVQKPCTCNALLDSSARTAVKGNVSAQHLDPLLPGYPGQPSLRERDHGRVCIIRRRNSEALVVLDDYLAAAAKDIMPCFHHLGQHGGRGCTDIITVSGQKQVEAVDLQILSSSLVLSHDL
eukprot:9150481-Pyramimonas_sp.AAC.1